MADQTSHGTTAVSASLPAADAPATVVFAIVDGPKATRTPGLSAFDGRPVEAALQELDALERPAERLSAIWAAYHTLLIPAWARLVDQTRQAVDRIEAEARGKIAAKKAEHDALCASAERAFEQDNAPFKERRRISIAQAAAFIDESNDHMARLWERVGPGLAINPPHPVPVDSLMSWTPDSETHYAGLAQVASALPPFGDLFDEPVIRHHLWKIALAVFVVGGLILHSFIGGIFMALCSAGAVIGLRNVSRSDARKAFERYVDAAQNEQALRWQRAGHVAAECDRQTNVLARQRDEAKATADLRLHQAVSEVSEKLKKERDAAGKAWHESALSCSEQVERIGAALTGVVAEHGLLLGPLAAGAGTIASGERLKLRIGELAPAALASLPPDSATFLGGGAPKPLQAAFPALWDGQARGALLLADARPAREGAGDFMSMVMARTLRLIPPGKVNFTLFDPVGLGHNFAGFLKLGDYAKELIGGQAWSAREHMRSRLRDIISHIETVTQKYLRKDYPDIESYNAKAGEIAEAYRLLAIADFPEQFDEEMMHDLERIVQNGPRCGVFTLLHVNAGAKAAHGVSAAPLQPFSNVVLRHGKGETTFGTTADGADAWPFRADGAPDDALLSEIVTHHGEGSKDAMRVEFSYQRLLERAHIDQEPWWGRSSRDGIEVPVGPLGAQKVQNFRLGKDLAHHALIVGRPGSGKSNLLHVFISTVCRLYSPDEVQLYLIDFKKGVEFKDYANAGLPHARVIAVESEREFGLSVLSGLDEEMTLRGERFRAANARSIGEFRSTTGEPLPRIVLIVDEFQEFFTRDDKIHREARVLFDRLVRQGRAFGVHVILGTQSLANAGVPPSTRDQMAIRIALQCSDADSQLILGDHNSAARLLTRPGEAIYNEQAGEIEGNNLFQVAIFADEDRRLELDRCAAVAGEREWKGPPPVVFEGHQPAQLDACPALQDAVFKPAGSELDMWVGEPVALKPVVSAALKRQAGRNLLILHKDEQQAMGVATSALLSLAAQAKPEDIRFSILNFAAADAEWAQHPKRFGDSIPHDASVGAKRELGPEIARHYEEVRRRIETEAAPPSDKPPTRILVLLGLHRMRDLRVGELGGSSGMTMNLDRADSGPPLPEQLAYILREGPEAGVHVIAWADGYSSLERVIDRRTVEEFGLRIAGPLASDESHRLFDSDAAAQIDKPYRMLNADEEKVGVLETFRPFALVSPAFLLDFGRRLQARCAGGGEA